MTVEGSKRLVLHGFSTKQFRKDYPDWGTLSDDKKRELVDKLSADGKIEGYADHDEIEISRDQVMKMDYPQAANRYYMIYEVPHESIEPVYFWSLGHLTYDWGFPVVDKITDVFTAAEHSSFYGAAAQRLGLAQDKVSQYLATIGKMIKDLFQLVREIRWIDERKKYYEDAEKGHEGAEIALKGLWTDMVDGVVGGQRTSSNIFVMAQQLQFAALPDVFFSIHVTKPIVAKLKGKPVKDVKDEDVRKVIDDLVEKQASGFNKELRNILKRKLYQYTVWRNETWLEIQQRRKFTLDYLRQHYEVVKMYMNWVKPYLKHIQKLGADVSKISSADLIAAFEGSLVEIEVLAQQIPRDNEDVYTCVLLTFQYRTRPQMAFAQEGGFHRGPLHQGETKIFWRVYAWDKKQIEAFKKLKDDEDLSMMGSIDASLHAAMDALGGDLRKYLDEAKKMHEAETKEEKAPAKQSSLAQPFKDIGKGFAETFTAFLPKKAKGKLGNREREIKNAAGFGKFVLWQHYKNFKKAHRLLTW